VLRTRLKTALIALPALLAIVVYAPQWAFSSVIGVLTLWALFEIGEITENSEWRWLLIGLAGGVPAVATLSNGYASPAGWTLCLIIFSFTMLLVARVAIKGAEQAANSGLLVVLGAAWVGIFFPYFAFVRNRAGGTPVLILMLLLAFASDTGAYFVGRFRGRIKLMPRVSPNKTIEGALGGLCAALVIGLILRTILVPGLSSFSVGVFSLAIAVLAQVGDLANSALKRLVGVKDSGWIFPGHGGLLDRACSLMFPVVFTYYYVR
jgi:phosphatidate cytidylyltransferase